MQEQEQQQQRTNNPERYRCNRCEKCFQNVHLYQAHQKHEKKPLRHCGLCSFKSCTTNAMVAHYKQQHPNKTWYMNNDSAKIGIIKSSDSLSMIKKNSSNTTEFAAEGEENKKIPPSTTASPKEILMKTNETKVKIEAIENNKEDEKDIIVAKNNVLEEQTQNQASQEKSNIEEVNCHLCDMKLTSQLSLLTHYEQIHPSIYEHHHDVAENQKNVNKQLTNIDGEDVNKSPSSLLTLLNKSEKQINVKIEEAVGGKTKEDENDTSSSTKQNNEELSAEDIICHRCDLNFNNQFSLLDHFTEFHPNMGGESSRSNSSSRSKSNSNSDTRSKLNSNSRSNSKTKIENAKEDTENIGGLKDSTGTVNTIRILRSKSSRVQNNQTVQPHAKNQVLNRHSKVKSLKRKSSNEDKKDKSEEEKENTDKECKSTPEIIPQKIKLLKKIDSKKRTSESNLTTSSMKKSKLNVSTVKNEKFESKLLHNDLSDKKNNTLLGKKLESKEVDEKMEKVLPVMSVDIKDQNNVKETEMDIGNSAEVIFYSKSKSFVLDL